MSTKQKATVLLVEDDIGIIDMLMLYLEEYGFNVIVAQDGQIALDKFEKNNVDVILLDIMLPVLNGYDVMRRIRRSSGVPIIVISSRDRDNEKIIGLNIGADDYITKPFNPLEVVARLNAQIRRMNEFSNTNYETFSECLTVRDITLDCGECKVYKHGINIDLTYTEFKLLKLWMSSPGRVFTKKQIFEKVWEDEFVFADNTITVYISRLREKIEEDSKKPEYIKTVRGLGYRIEKE